MSMPSDDDTAPRAAETLAAVSARLATQHKLDPALFRVVEVIRQADGRLSKQGQIWHSDLAHARRFGRVLAANSTAQKVQVADAAGTVVETIPSPPPGSPAPGWGDWRELPLPPAPPVQRKRVAPPRVAAPAPAVAAPPLLPAPLPVPAALPVMAPENEVERTSTLTP
jgi:hypothetical protein